MTEHVTIELDAEALQAARLAAEAEGVAMEVYLRQLITANLPVPGFQARPNKFLEEIFGMGSSAEPTDIAKDEDKLIGEAVWEGYLRKTQGDRP
jgi:hypothetical protein